MPKQTYQPKTRKRARRHGFLERMSTVGGKKAILNRRRKGRTNLTTV
ncbi:MAG: 50S ribosomal protein L34 [Minisyncoccota bacterium]